MLFKFFTRHILIQNALLLFAETYFATAIFLFEIGKIDSVCHNCLATVFILSLGPHPYIFYYLLLYNEESQAEDPTGISVYLSFLFVHWREISS